MSPSIKPDDIVVDRGVVGIKTPAAILVLVAWLGWLSWKAVEHDHIDQQQTDTLGMVTTVIERKHPRQ